MLYTYDDYLTMPKSLPIERMEQIYRQMAAEIDDQDPDAAELYQLLMNNAIRYSQIRASWQLSDSAERAAADSGRSSCHNALISSFDFLARYLRGQGKAAAWRDALGYEQDDRLNRKVIGDFACYLVFVQGILAR